MIQTVLLFCWPRSGVFGELAFFGDFLHFSRVFIRNQDVFFEMGTLIDDKISHNNSIICPNDTKSLNCYDIDNFDTDTTDRFIYLGKLFLPVIVAFMFVILMFILTYIFIRYCKKGRNFSQSEDIFNINIPLRNIPLNPEEFFELKIEQTDPPSYDEIFDKNSNPPPSYSEAVFVNS